MKVVRIESTGICPFVQVDAIHAFPTVSLLLVFDEVTGASITDSRNGVDYIWTRK